MSEADVNPPSPACSENLAELSRRKFLARLSWLTATCGALVVSVPILGFILAPFFVRKPNVWRVVGPVDKFKIGETIAVKYEDPSPYSWAGVTAHNAAWLRRESAETFIAFSINCTHLGCPVRWLAEANLFMCPCHGGVYYQDGTVAAGPPPRPLPRYPVRIVNGEVQIQTTATPIDTQ